MTPRKSAPLFCTALLIALFASGCRQDTAAEAETAAETDTRDATEAGSEPTTEPAPVTAPPPPPTPEPGTDAEVVEDRGSPTAAAPTFDAKAFAGRYAAGDTALEVSADGTFTLSGKDGETTGTWTLQPGGTKVTLDPDSKSEQDRTLDVMSTDSVKLDGVALQRG